MAKTGTVSDYYAKINKIVNYFARNSNGGFLFCSLDKIDVTNEINRYIIYRAEQKNLTVKEVYLSFEDAQDFLNKIREAAKEKPDGIIISNLDELIVLTKDQIIKDFNLSRDILLNLKLPFLFCVSKKNISKFANQAQDLFLRRDRGVIHFSNIPGKKRIEEFKDFFTKEYWRSTEYKSLELGKVLLESQLKEAEEKRYRPERIANEIALDLIHLYLNTSLIIKAKELFYKYKHFLDLENNLKAITITAKLYNESGQLDKAFDYYLKAKNIVEKTGDMRVLGTILNEMALLYDRKLEWEKAREFSFRSLKISRQLGDIPGIGIIFNNIGLSYYKSGDLNKALEFFYKSLEAANQKVSGQELLVSLNLNIGAVYFRKEKFDKALEFCLKSKEISEKIGDIDGLGKAYDNIGLIFYHKNQMNNALEYYMKAKEIFEKIGYDDNLKSINERIQSIKENQEREAPV